MDWIMGEIFKSFAEIMEKKVYIYTESLENNAINSEEHNQAKENLVTEAGEEFKKAFLKLFNILDVLYENLQ